MKFAAAIIAFAASASAFAPATFGTRTSTRIFADRGEYVDQVWDITSKTDVYNKWDPSQPRSAMNFNPFENWDGNTPDSSGVYPGEPFYKDPIRGDMNYEIMQKEQAAAAERAANPKPGDVPGAPGCRN